MTIGVLSQEQRIEDQQESSLAKQKCNRGGASASKVIIVTGPTAVGKTNVSLELAEALGGEIISADSVQIYKGLDIGSDKIPLAQRRGIPHHLLDILPPTADFSAGHFYQLARAATEDILQRGKVPIVVGGTGFYLRWYIHGKPGTPRSNPTTLGQADEALDKARADAAGRKGSQLTAQESWEAGVQAVAAAGDPEAAKKLRLVPNNEYRLRRVLEVVQQTERPISEADLDRSAPLDYDFRCFFLVRPRTQLYDRIGIRCEQMLLGGLLQEAQCLLNQGLEADTSSPTRAIGYRQALQFLQRARDDPSTLTEENLLQLVRDMQAASRNLSQKQLKWFRDKEPLFCWINAARPVADVVAAILNEIKDEQHKGNLGDDGRLSKQEERDLKGYTYTQQLLSKHEAREAILHSLL